MFFNLFFSIIDTIKFYENDSEIRTFNATYHSILEAVKLNCEKATKRSAGGEKQYIFIVSEKLLASIENRPESSKFC